MMLFSNMVWENSHAHNHQDAKSEHNSGGVCTVIGVIHPDPEGPSKNPQQNIGPLYLLETTAGSPLAQFAQGNHQLQAFSRRLMAIFGSQRNLKHARNPTRWQTWWADPERRELTCHAAPSAKAGALWGNGFIWNRSKMIGRHRPR